jgi:hypothetical protein
LLVRPSLAVRLDYARPIEMNERGTRILAILGQPPLGLSLVAALTEKARTKYERATESLLSSFVDTASYLDLSFESPATGLEYRAALALRPQRYDRGPCPLKFSGVFPLPTNPEPVVSLITQLAEALDACAGFVACEPSPGLAHSLAVGSGMPTKRDGLSDERRRARRAHDKWHEQVAAKIATVEWGTFLGPGHLAPVDLEKLRASNAFIRVEAISPSLAFLQLTANPLDDLSGTLEQHISLARGALGPLLIDSRGVNLE